jgi:hypothetical protein
MKSLIIIFISLQFTLNRIVERHACFLYDLLNSTTLIQKIVACSVLPITEIIDIKEHKLSRTFLYATFGSQRLLESTSDQTDSNTN